jgi:N-acetylmuramoyl-L-alanine amidase
LGAKLRRALRTVEFAAAAAILGGVLWLAAPAISTRPIVPRPVDFELRDRPPSLELAADGHAASRLAARVAEAHGSRGRVAVLQSRPLRTSRRFNLVGLRWRGTDAVALTARVHEATGDWTRWVHVPVDPDHGPDPTSRERRKGWTASDPLWAGEADRVQYRIAAAGAVKDLTLHFVNSKGTATALDRLRSSVRHAVANVVGGLARLVGVGAHAQTTQPEIVTRAQWGADACRPRATPEYGEVKLAFIHHTVTATDYGPQDSASMVLAVCRYHRNSNGWNDIGYQFVVDRYGKIFEGRAGGIDQAVVGAQAQGYNTQSTGIANLGTFSTVGQTEAGLRALAKLISWKFAVHGVPPTGTATVRSAGGALNRYPAGTDVVLNRISGHRDGDNTSCPGDGLYAQLPRLRGMVTGDTRPGAAVDLGAARRNIPYGRKVRLTGHLRTAAGSAVVGERVRIQALGGAAGVRTLARARTASDGSFALKVRLAFNRALQAYFAGNAGVAPARSISLPVGVRPRVTAALNPLAGTGLRAGGRVLVTGSVRPRKRTALLLVDRELSDGSFRRVAAKRLRVRLGHISVYHRFRRPGHYRVRLGVDRDSRNLSARSEPVAVLVS